MQRQLAVAFQGGGARLIGLIAAAHALSELEKSLGIKVTAVSGSSAGSIAAFLLAADADFDRVKDAIRRVDPLIKKYFPKFGPRKLYYKLLRFFLTGAPLYNPKHLELIVDRVLTEAGVNPSKRIKDLDLSKDMYLMFSDIYSASSEPASDSEIIRTAITRSCSLPIVFSSYKDLEGGQRVDGGMLDNLPTDILMSAQAELRPVFAIGFKAESKETVNSPSTYMHALATAGIQYRIFSSKKAVGEDMVLELDTSLETLDFDKIVDVGIEKEYAQIKDETRQFFLAYLSGQGDFKDPMSETRGLAPFYKLKSIEKSIHDYVYDSMTKAKCRNKYIKMRVNAYSLANPSNYDEIHWEQLIEFPDGDYIKGTLIPMIAGAGHVANVECQVCIGGPEGVELKYEQFFIKDFYPGINHIGTYTDAVVLLFKGDLKPLIGKSVYILKKEKRYGFMLDLQARKSDYLSVRSIYWPAEEVNIALSVPKEFPELRCQWVREGGEPGPPPEKNAPIQSLVPAGFVSYTQALRKVGLGTRFKGNFAYVEYDKFDGSTSRGDVESAKARSVASN